VSALPDPLEFTERALAARGALIERTPDASLLALTPPDVARALGLPEESHLVAHARDDLSGAITCGLGSPLLEKLVAEARARTPAALVALDRDPPKASHARAMAERLVVRNGLVEVGDALVGEGLYLALTVAWTAEADDRHEGTVTAHAQSPDGALPSPSVQTVLDGLLDGGGSPVPAHLAPFLAPETPSWLAARAEMLVEEAIGPVREGVARRHARDHERIIEYFTTLITEARAPRRRIDAAAVEARVGQFVAERDAKLGALAPRFTLRVSSAPAGLLGVVVPVVRVKLKLRRRKESREVAVTLPAGATALDAPLCEGCLGGAPRPALCDDRLHLLCERCAPHAQGRVACPACARAPTKR
jgi:hypothetical protein